MHHSNLITKTTHAYICSWAYICNMILISTTKKTFHTMHRKHNGKSKHHISDKVEHILWRRLYAQACA